MHSTLRSANKYWPRLTEKYLAVTACHLHANLANKPHRTYEIHNASITARVTLRKVPYGILWVSKKPTAKCVRIYNHTQHACKTHSCTSSSFFLFNRKTSVPGNRYVRLLLCHGSQGQTDLFSRKNRCSYEHPVAWGRPTGGTGCDSKNCLDPNVKWSRQRESESGNFHQPPKILPVQEGKDWKMEKVNSCTTEYYSWIVSSAYTFSFTWRI